MPRRGKKSFSDLFERLIDGNIHNGIDALKKIRGSIEFDQEIKDKILRDIALQKRLTTNLIMVDTDVLLENSDKRSNKGNKMY